MSELNIYTVTVTVCQKNSKDISWQETWKEIAAPDEDSVKEQAALTIDRFNKELRPGEVARELVNVDKITLIDDYESYYANLRKLMSDWDNWDDYED